jgi:hypothetical protein
MTGYKIQMTVRCSDGDSHIPSVPSRVDLLEAGMFVRTRKD